jgi:hypothetical protein
MVADDLFKIGGIDIFNNDLLAESGEIVQNISIGINRRRKSYAVKIIQVIIKSQAGFFRPECSDAGLRVGYRQQGRKLSYLLHEKFSGGQIRAGAIGHRKRAAGRQQSRNCKPYKNNRNQNLNKRKTFAPPEV